MSIRIDGTNTTANPGITGGDADTGLQFGTDEVSIVTGGTNRVEVNASNAAVVTIPQDGNQLLLKQTDTDSGYLLGCSNTNGDLTFSRRALGSNTEEFRMLAGGGLTFNGDTAAANALDDYEEGTFTPAVSGNPGLSVAEGRYTKIGNRVYFNLYVQLNSIATSTNLQINNLPFASGTGNQAMTAYGRAWQNSWTSDGNNVQWLHLPGLTSIGAYQTLTSGSVSSLNSTVIGTAGNVIISGHYKID